MALQLLKRNYTMNGYEKPKILKIPEGEMRWAPRRDKVDVGDVMMSVRLDDGKNNYINEKVSKYAKGLNPYGEFGYPYKVNKAFRPPIIDPKALEPLSRMPVKFDSVSRGPIVKNLYEKQTEFVKQVPSRTIINKVSASSGSNLRIYKDPQVLNAEYNLPSKLHASTTTNLSIPSSTSTDVPELNLDPKIRYSATVNMYSPYVLIDMPHDIMEKNAITQRIRSTGQTNLSSLDKKIEVGEVTLLSKLPTSSFESKPSLPVEYTQNLEYSRLKPESPGIEYFADRFTTDAYKTAETQKHTSPVIRTIKKKSL